MRRFRILLACPTINILGDALISLCVIFAFLCDSAVNAFLLHIYRRVAEERRDTQRTEAVARGLSNKEIAAELKLSLRTIEGHISRILDKKNLSNRVELTLQIRERRQSN